MSNRKWALYVEPLNEAANEALATLLNAMAASAEQSKVQIEVKGRVIDDVFIIPGHHVLNRIIRSDRASEYRVYRKERHGEVLPYNHWKPTKKTTKDTRAHQDAKAFVEGRAVATHGRHKKSR